MLVRSPASSHGAPRARKKSEQVQLRQLEAQLGRIGLQHFGPETALGVAANYWVVMYMIAAVVLPRVEAIEVSSHARRLSARGPQAALVEVYLMPL